MKVFDIVVAKDGVRKVAGYCDEKCVGYKMRIETAISRYLFETIKNKNRASSQAKFVYFNSCRRICWNREDKRALKVCLLQICGSQNRSIVARNCSKDAILEDKLRRWR